MMATNVFLLATEHHFLVALSIIEEKFPAFTHINKFFFVGDKRLSQVKKSALPKHIIASDLNFDLSPDFVNRVKNEVYNTEVENLFVVNTYRPCETFILSRAPRGVKRHLIQDGALFYNRIERSVFVNHTKTVLYLYRDLWRKGIWFTDFLYYGRFMENCDYIDEIWMTHPEYYVGPKSKKPKHGVNLFPSENSIRNYTQYFDLPIKIIEILNNCLLYLPVYIKKPELIPLEIENIRTILDKIKTKNILIKLHPNSSEAQYLAFKQEFGEIVFKNNIAAEIYIANANNSYIIGCNSTSLFYNNASCKYFALKKFYQDLGIFSSWYNINMPKHIKVVNSLNEII